MKQILFFITAVISLALPSYAAQKMIAITQIIEHPSADKTREGVILGLAQRGYVDGDNIKIIYENAQGNITTAIQIAQKFVGLNPDVIVPITTPSAQTIAAATRNKSISVVFASVTDPLHAKIVTDLDKPGGNVTGAIDYPPVNYQMGLIDECVPFTDTVGMIYNPGEVNSVKMFELAKEHAEQYGFSVIAATAVNSKEVPSAVSNLVSKQVDAVYISLDNNVLSAMDSVLKITNKYKIPVFSSDPDSVDQGVMAAFCYTQHEAGRLAGGMIADILEGADTATMSVQAPPKAQLFINMDAASAIDFELPDSVIERADKIIE